MPIASSARTTSAARARVGHHHALGDLELEPRRGGTDHFSEQLRTSFARSE